MRFLKYYILLLFSTTLLLVGVSFIPHKAIEENCRLSVNTVYKNGDNAILLGIPLFKIDTFTDILMLNIAYLNDEKKAVESAFLNYYYYNEKIGLFDSSQKVINNDLDKHELTTYATYWHGYQIFLKPILVITEYKWFIIINYILLSLICVYTLYLIRKKCSPVVAYSLCTALILTGFPVVPTCIQFSICFYLMFLFVCVILNGKQISDNVASLFFIFGALTSFFDLLTTPQITLGIPLVIYITKYTTTHRLKSIIQLSLAWIIGYASFWISKCFIGWLFTGYNIFNDFYESAQIRSIFGLNTIKSLLTMPITYLIIMTIVTLIVFIFIYAYRWLLRHSNFSDNYGWLIIVAMITPVWYFFMMQHTIIHYWFTWRAILITLFSMFIILNKMVVDYKNRIS